MTAVNCELEEVMEFEEEFANFEGFLEEIEELARDYIKNFFHNREMHCGGTVTKSVALSSYYVSLVMNTDISKASDTVYEALENNHQIDTSEHNDGSVSEDIRIMISALDVCAAAGIPKCFAGGITIMYLELCEGYNVC